MEGERLSVLDTTAWLFSDPDNVRFGKYSRKVAMLAALGVSAVPDGRLGTYDRNVRAINDMFDQLDSNAKLERWQRDPMIMDEEHPLVLVRLLVPASQNRLQTFDQIELARRGLRTQIALERYRNKHGRYPSRLEDLLDVQPSPLPPDPWSGKPFGYRPIDPAADPVGRGYLLYSIGADGRDDGGGPAKSRLDALFRPDAVPETPGATGTDFIINTFERAEPLDGLPTIPDPTKPAKPADGSAAPTPDAPVN